MKKKLEEKTILTTHEAARLLYVTPTTVIQWIKDGKIKCIHTIGGHRRIKISEIDRVRRKYMGFENGASGGSCEDAN